MKKSVKSELKKLAARVEALEARVGSMNAEKRRGDVMSAPGQPAEQSPPTPTVSDASCRYRAVDKKGRVFLDEAAIGCDFRLTDLPGGAFLLEPTDEVPGHQRWTALPKVVRELEEFMRECTSLHANGPTDPSTPTYEADDGPLTDVDLNAIQERASKSLPEGPVVPNKSLLPESLPRSRKRTGTKRPGPC